MKLGISWLESTRFTPWEKASLKPCYRVVWMFLSRLSVS